MTKQLKIILTENELQMLNQIAAKQCRRATDQARFFVVSALDPPNDKMKCNTGALVIEARAGVVETTNQR